MPAIPTNNIVTANGDYYFKSFRPGTEVLLEWEVTAGTATVSPGRITPSGAFRAVVPLDGTPPVFAASGGDCVLALGNSSQAALSVTAAAGGFSMNVSQTKIDK